MFNQMHRFCTPALVLAAFALQGCANVVGDPTTEVVSNAPISERGDSRFALVFADAGTDSLSPESRPIRASTLSVSAVIVEPITITTERNQRTSQLVIPYSGVTELADFPLSLLVGWVEFLEGNRGFVSYMDGLNPFINSDRFTQRREAQILSESAMQPTVERRSDIRRIEGARIALGFPGLPRVEFNSKEASASRISLDQLMTRPLTSAPRTIEGQVLFRGQSTPVQAKVEIAPEISNRLLEASRQIARMNPGNPMDVAAS